MNKKLYLIPVYLLLCSNAVNASEQANNSNVHYHKLTHSSSQEKAEVEKTIDNQFAHATSMNAKIGRIKITYLDIETPWAYATIHALDKEIDDPIMLLHKRGGRWKVITLGTNLQGAGREFGVPHRLWKRWGLENEAN